MNETDKTVWMTAKEVISVLECSRDYLVVLVQNGVIKRRETGAHRRYLRTDVEKLIAAQEKATA